MTRLPLRCYSGSLARPWECWGKLSNQKAGLRGIRRKVRSPRTVPVVGPLSVTEEPGDGHRSLISESQFQTWHEGVCSGGHESERKLKGQHKGQAHPQ